MAGGVGVGVWGMGGGDWGLGCGGGGGSPKIDDVSLEGVTVE